MFTVEGNDGTYCIYLSATTRIEHQKLDGSMEVYYSIDEIPDIYDRKRVMDRLEEED